MSTRPPPLMESRKVLEAARPPVGEGPPVRVVLDGLRRTRPPAAVLLATALMALVPLALLGLSGWVAWTALGGDSPWWLAALRTVLLAGTVFLLAALSWRGVKRALHQGEYGQGFFVARLVTVGCVVVAGFLAWYVLSEGNPWDPTMAVPFVVLAFVWLPLLPLQAASARAWPDDVLLRRGPEVRGYRELAFLLAARTDVCGAPLAGVPVAPTADRESDGWVVAGRCPACGGRVTRWFQHRAEDAPDPADPTAWGRPGSRPCLGGGDLVHLTGVFEVPAGTDPAALDDGDLAALAERALAAVQSTEQLLALVPAGRGSVPPWRRTGRAVPLLFPAEEFTRPVLERRLAERRAVLAAVAAEQSRRQHPA